MIDTRENILNRLFQVCEGVQGVQQSGRNLLDFTSDLARPGLIVHDGEEEFFDRPQGQRQGQVQRMHLMPKVVVLLRSDVGESGPLLSMYRGRVISAVLSDTDLRGFVGGSGHIQYSGCTVDEPTPDSKEPRMEINFSFTYAFRASDLLGE